ncbi:glycosyltransferase [Desulfobacula phenolica]|uniref:UDP:flavonoid glycosyltransferase YjiC, YdhE family n=1 Tax=Desulfobacula phenolica TaxID=90732 RepID=A0A1H2EQA5_9BACT|nr:nucleotide disphospho-sugar-binding domain-containing protein [Desulfobacula phenolica]SDT97307.1 UDP:flavonoid glycosyltransferase YjiC, YdhE family [Desulfobacula phenolica]
MIILCIPYTHTLSHLSRPLVLAKELKSRGHEVIFAGESSNTAFIRQEGFSVLPVYEPDPEILFGNIRKGKLRFISNAEIEHMIEADLALYSVVKPDIVLTDGRFTAPISTHMAKIVHAAIVNASSTEYRALPYIPFFDWLHERLIKRDTRLWKILDQLNLRLEMLVFDNIMNIFKRLSKKHGLKKTITSTNCLTGKDITFLADIPEYFPTKNLPKDYYHIGPITWQSNLSPPAWWPPNARNQLIYITMGTTGLGDFFQLAYNLFQEGQYTCVMTTGRQSERMPTIPGHIYIEEYIDGDMVVKACDAVVCHGGNGTIYQALLHGKPIIGISTIPDQAYNMRRVESLRVGMSLSWKEFYTNPKMLLDTIHAVLANTYFAKNARQMQKILKTCRPAKTAADIMERYMKTKS